MEKEIIVYEAASEQKLQVKTYGETVWLTQEQMCQLLGRERSVITKHINNAIREGEVSAKSNVQNLHIANSDKPVKFYDLDVVISVGYRVKSLQGTLFRRWATRILREMLLRRLCASVYDRTSLFGSRCSSRHALPTASVSLLIFETEILPHPSHPSVSCASLNDPSVTASRETAVEVGQGLAPRFRVRTFDGSDEFEDADEARTRQGQTVGARELRVGRAVGSTASFA